MIATRRNASAAYGALVLLVVAGRLAWFGAPPGGDLGQYMYMGGVVLDGGAPYADAANNKGPATFLLFALLRLVCGGSPDAVRLVLVLVAAVGAVAVGRIVAHHAGTAAGAVAAVAYALLSSAVAFEGGDPNNTQFGVVAMVGAWALATLSHRRAPFAAGATAAFAFWMNPAFGIALPFVAWELALSSQRRVALRGGAAGAAVVSVVLLGWMAATGVVNQMGMQVFGKVSRTVVAGGGAAEGAVAERSGPLSFVLELPEPPLWAAGLVACAIAARERRLRPLAVAAALWIALGWLRVEVAGYAFANQYVPVLAGIAMALALAIAAVWRDGLRERVAVAVLVLAVPVWSAVVEPQLTAFALPVAQRGNPLVDPVVDVVRDRTQPGDTVQMAESDAQVLWLADRRAPTRFFDSFGIGGRERYLAEWRALLEADPPDAVAALPDRLIDPALQALLDSGAYELVHDRDGARVWLRR